MKSKIAQKTRVQCPLPQAAQRLRAFFAAHGNRDGDVALLPLSIDVTFPALDVPMRIARNVIVTITPDHKPADMVPRYHVAWEPEGAGLFPLFAGELNVESDDDYDAFWLTLLGTYKPPLGLVGAAFDVVVGSHIAAICARNFLATIAESIEAAFVADEANKVHAR